MGGACYPNAAHASAGRFPAADATPPSPAACAGKSLGTTDTASYGGRDPAGSKPYTPAIAIEGVSPGGTTLTPATLPPPDPRGLATELRGWIRRPNPVGGSSPLLRKPAEGCRE